METGFLAYQSRSERPLHKDGGDNLNEVQFAGAGGSSPGGHRQFAQNAGNVGFNGWETDYQFSGNGLGQVINS